MAESEPIHVLVVDDQVRVNETIVDILESRGYRVSSATSGFAMFDLLRRDGSVAAVVLDSCCRGRKASRSSCTPNNWDWLSSWSLALMVAGDWHLSTASRSF